MLPTNTRAHYMSKALYDSDRAEVSNPALDKLITRRIGRKPIVLATAASVLAGAIIDQVPMTTQQARLFCCAWLEEMSYGHYRPLLVDYVVCVRCRGLHKLPIAIRSPYIYKCPNCGDKVENDNIVEIQRQQAETEDRDYNMLSLPTYLSSNTPWPVQQAIHQAIVRRLKNRGNSHD